MPLREIRIAWSKETRQTRKTKRKQKEQRLGLTSSSGIRCPDRPWRFMFLCIVCVLLLIGRHHELVDQYCISVSQLFVDLLLVTQQWVFNIGNFVFWPLLGWSFTRIGVQRFHDRLLPFRNNWLHCYFAMGFVLFVVVFPFSLFRICLVSLRYALLNSSMGIQNCLVTSAVGRALVCSSTLKFCLFLGYLLSVELQVF